jgi:hypothetical protein
VTLAPFASFLTQHTTHTFAEMANQNTDRLLFLSSSRPTILSSLIPTSSATLEPAHQTLPSSEGELPHISGDRPLHTSDCDGALLGRYTNHIRLTAGLLSPTILDGI